MTFKQAFISAFIITAVALCAGIYLGVSATREPTAGDIGPGLLTMARSATVAVGTGSTGVASSSSSRRFLQLQNTSATVSVYCAYSGATAAVGSQGFFISASSTLTFPTGNGPVYAGPLNCIASSTVLLLVNEG